MFKMLKKLSLHVASTLLMSIIFSGVAAGLVWFLDNVLGINSLEVPFTLAWYSAFVVFVALLVFIQAVSILIIIGWVVRLYWKWAPTPMADILEGINKYDLLRQKGFANWDAEGFKTWLVIKRGDGTEFPKFIAKVVADMFVAKYRT